MKKYLIKENQFVRLIQVLNEQKVVSPPKMGDEPSDGEEAPEGEEGEELSATGGETASGEGGAEGSTETGGGSSDSLSAGGEDPWSSSSDDANAKFTPYDYGTAHGVANPVGNMVWSNNIKRSVANSIDPKSKWEDLASPVRGKANKLK